MHSLIREVQKDQLKKIPQIKPGYTVSVHQRIKEGEKERVQIFEGLVIKVGHGEGVEKTFTVRKVVQGIGVEKIFPMHSSNIVKVVVKKIAKIRRSKLYYMRERFGKSARLKERFVSDQERAEEEKRIEAQFAQNQETPSLEVNTDAPEVSTSENNAAPVEVNAAPEATEAPAKEAPKAEEKTEEAPVAEEKAESEASADMSVEAPTEAEKKDEA